MAEKIVSPGVFTKEIDQSFLPAAIGDIGAVVIGPTVKGPAGIPTIVESYSEFQAKFGDTFKSGSNYQQYLTSHTAREYLKSGPRLTVVRILDGTYGKASASVPTGSATGGTSHSGSSHSSVTDYDAMASAISFKLHTLADGAIMNSAAAAKGGYEGGAVDRGINNVLLSGSKNNLRWEISTQNASKGTFTLLIRRGDDNIKRKSILETWNNLSLDPNKVVIEKKV